MLEKPRSLPPEFKRCTTFDEADASISHDLRQSRLGSTHAGIAISLAASSSDGGADVLLISRLPGCVDEGILARPNTADWPRLLGKWRAQLKARFFTDRI